MGVAGEGTWGSCWFLPPFDRERGPHPMAVVGERTNDRMLVQKRQRFLSRATALEQLAKRAADETRRRRAPSGKPGPSRCRYADWPTQSKPCSTRSPSIPRALQHGFGPLVGLRADGPGLRQQPDCPAFDAADLLGDQVLAQRAEAARLLPHVYGDLLQPTVEDADQARVPACPDCAAEILGRHRVIRLGHFDVAVATDDAPSFLERRESVAGQRPERRTLDLGKHLAHLLLGGAVDSRVGHTPLPELQVAVLGFQRSERVPLERVAFDVADAALDLALVPRRARLGGQDHRAVVLAEREQLGIQLGIEPVGMRDGRLEVVDDQRLGHPAEMPEGILDRPQEVFGRLAVADFAISLAGMRQHDAKDMRLAPLADTDRRLVRQRDRHTRAEVDLSLFARARIPSAETALRAVKLPAASAVSEHCRN